MDGKQYEQTIRNRRGYDLQPLFAGQGLASVMRGAARAAKQLRLADDAWERVVSPATCAISRVASYRNGVLLIALTDPTAGHHLQCGAGELRRKLAAVLPGLRDVRFTQRAVADSDAIDEHPE
jgi:hypothetical protein